MGKWGNDGMVEWWNGGLRGAGSGELLCITIDEGIVPHLEAP